MPQFLVVTYEIFDFGMSVRFIQAFNPIFTVFMIYKNQAVLAGEALYTNIVAFAIFFPLMVLPQLILSMHMARNMYSKPQSLIDAQMFNPDELQPGLVSRNMVFPIIVAIALISFGGFKFATRHAK